MEVAKAMTYERTRERDPRLAPEPETERPATRDERRSDETEPNTNPWTREGADAPDAADIEEPEEQR
jgi:hypothetical protein